VWKSVRIKDCESWSGASVRKQSGAELAYRVQLDLELMFVLAHGTLPPCSLERVVLALDFNRAGTRASMNLI